jgi:elongation factor 2
MRNKGKVIVDGKEFAIEPVPEFMYNIIEAAGLVGYAKQLKEAANWDAKVGRNVWAIEGTSMLIDQTRGVQRLERIKPYVITAFRDFCASSALAHEPVMAMKVTVFDATIHEDPAHTKGGQIMIMTAAGLNISFLAANPGLYEPVLRIDIKTPEDTMGHVIGYLTQHRGRVTSTDSKAGNAYLTGELPASEASRGIADELRSTTSGAPSSATSSRSSKCCRATCTSCMYRLMAL